MWSLRRIAAVTLMLISGGVLALDANEEITPAEAGYQYLVYSVTWQPSFCKLKPVTAGCDHPPAKFLTHGIWPYNNSLGDKTNRHPAFCNTAPSCKQGQECEISNDTLQQVAQRDDIVELVTTSPEAMFKHEWKKHGTCSGKTEEKYFNDIVKLRNSVSYNEAMFAAWIGRSVRFDDLKAIFPSNASFRCFVLEGKQYLHEVFYRINDNGIPYVGDATLQIGTACKSQETFVPEGG